MRARYYDPEIGRFISEDEGRSGTNWYAYCNNSPVGLVDPSGNSPLMENLISSSTASSLWSNSGAALGFAFGVINKAFQDLTTGTRSSWQSYLAAGIVGGALGGFGPVNESVGYARLVRSFVDDGQTAGIGIKIAAGYAGLHLAVVEAALQNACIAGIRVCAGDKMGH